MDLIIDGQVFQADSLHRGIGRYSLAFIESLSSFLPSWKIRLVVNDRLPRIPTSICRDVPRSNFHPPLTLAAKNSQANELYYADWLNDSSSQAILIPSFFESAPVVVPTFVGAHKPLFGIVYDLIPLLFSDRYLLPEGAPPSQLSDYAARFRQLLQSDCMLSVTETVAGDLQRLLHPPRPNIVSVGRAVSRNFIPLPEGEGTTRIVLGVFGCGLRGDFILCVGGMDWRKNTAGAVEALGALKRNFGRSIDLVITHKLSGDWKSELENTAARLAVREHVKFTDFVSNDELRALYQSARLLLFPSRCASLGLPVLEAFTFGIPVVASDLASIRELAGDKSRYVDPTRPDLIAEAVEECLKEPPETQRRDRIAQAGKFTWKEIAEKFAAISASPLPIHKPVKPRIAWVSPIPPAESGIADYVMPIVHQLKHEFEMELIVDVEPEEVDGAIAAEFKIVHFKELPVRHAFNPYSAFCVGCVWWGFYFHMPDLLRRHSGILVLHDLNLSAIAANEGLAALGNRSIARFTASLATTATVVAVHSEWTKQRLEGITDHPIIRMTFGVKIAPRNKLCERERLGIPRDPYVICSLGNVGPTKRIPSLLRAISQLPPEIRSRCLLLIVGDAITELSMLTKLVTELRIGDNVRFLGRVDEEEFAGYASAADVCVQLRHPSNGETSAALIHAWPPAHPASFPTAGRWAIIRILW